MKNKVLTFKTNINCSGCVATVTPHLDSALGAGQWEVDTQSKDKILMVNSEAVTQDRIVEVVTAAGFKIQEFEPGS